jgi:hypothetical protein
VSLRFVGGFEGCDNLQVLQMDYDVSREYLLLRGRIDQNPSAAVM